MVETWLLSKCFSSTWIVLREETCSSLDWWELPIASVMLSFESSTFNVFHRPRGLLNLNLSIHRKQRQWCDWQARAQSVSFNSLLSNSNVRHTVSASRRVSLSMMPASYGRTTRQEEENETVRRLTQKLPDILSHVDQHKTIGKCKTPFRASPL